MYTLFTKLIAPIVKEYFAALVSEGQINPELEKIIRPLNLYRILYIVMVEHNIFQAYAGAKNWTDYAAMKKGITGNKEAQAKLLEDFIATYIKDDKFTVTINDINYYLSEFKEDDGALMFDHIVGDVMDYVNQFPLEWRKDSNLSTADKRKWKGLNEELKEAVDLHVSRLADALRQSRMFGGIMPGISQEFDHGDKEFDANASSFLGFLTISVNCWDQYIS